ncbi:phenylacetic acid degradation operon negative regulatory protein [Microbacterium resistens]|uniref:Phenylacetic acid degradation operon negative regulatory protein n=1 Tax=Microbacterium resistens TaxID=156977 RepID=A0ABU1SBV0_9MICO|nr:PaaX family transcriptional regulator C-terminal domain-containing protein [Microbacterium resistens]MDR6867089.1 phenylacetic acid degradation operon negative regulatory protein [Microbacterium resistens]
MPSETPDALPVPAPRTVVEACFDSAGRASLRFVYDLAEALGIDAQPVRLAIRRIEAAGIARQEGRGRAGTLVRTARGPRKDPVTAGRLRRARALEHVGDGWDGHWRLTSFSLPEERRADRDALRSALARFGGVTISPALYLSFSDPRPPILAYGGLPDPRVVDVMIVAEAARIDIAGLTDPADILARYWDLPAAALAYEQAERAIAVAEASPVPTSPVARAAAALLLSEPFAQALADDPLIPAELLPADWPPRRVRERFLGAWARLVDSAEDIDLYRQYAPDLPA